MHIAQSHMALPGAGHSLVRGLAGELNPKQVTLAGACVVTLPAKIECQNLQAAAVGQAAPDHGLAGCLCLQRLCIQTKAAAFVVVTQCVVVAVDAEQNLMRADLEVGA